MVMANMFDELIRISFSFPTVVFTFLLCIMMGIWLITVAGLLDLDFFNIDIDVDIDTTGAETGVGEALAGLLTSWGLTGVPLTISLSFFTLVSWATSFQLVYMGFDYIPGGPLTWLASAGVVLVSFVIAIRITVLVIKPMRPLFKNLTRTVEKTILGRIAVVRSSRVSDSFGEAIFNDMGADIMLKIRCEDSKNTFKKGDRVVPIKYDKATHTYTVVSENQFKN